MASGLVSAPELADLEAHADDIDIDAALAIEHEIGHDLMAEIRVFASQATIGGGKLHLGATSMDIEDTVETYRMRAAISSIGENVHALLAAFAEQIDRHAALVCMAHTHLQPAEPTTVGYRLAVYAQDLLIDERQLRFALEQLTAKGMRGAVGTSASYVGLLEGTGRTAETQERDVLASFGLSARDASTQTYPRKLDYLVLSTLAGLAASLSKFAADIRILSSSGFGELFEPFGKKQVGSSAMPFKRNPVMSERIDSIARLVLSYSDVAWQNAATNYLERTLDDSANRRTILPEAILATDEIVTLARKIVAGLRVDERRIAQNLATYGPFAGSEAVLLAAAKAGGDRQALHETIRDAAMKAYDALGKGEANPLPSLLRDDAEIGRFVHQDQIDRLLDPAHHIGDAESRARRVAARIRDLGAFPQASDGGANALQFEARGA